MSTVSKFSFAKTYNIRARLRRENFANFLDYYHKGTAETDHFYQILSKIISDHKLGCNDELIQFYTPMTSEGFYFKSPDVKCKNLIGKPCLIDDILDNDAVIRLKVRPYDFVNENKRMIGVSIHAVEIVAKHAKL